MKAIMSSIRGLFSVYSEWNGSHRVSREMVITSLMVVSSIWSYFAEYELFQGNEVAVIGTGIFGAIGLVLRISSKGGESVLKPSVKREIEKQEAIKEAMGTRLGPDLDL